MKDSVVYVSGGVIVAILFLAVFVGGANAGDCSRSRSAEAPAAKVHHFGIYFVPRVSIESIGSADF